MISEGANGEEERTEGEGAEGAVGGGVRVAADAGRAGQREALLGPDDVHDALALVGHAEVLDAEVLDVPLERLHLGPRRDVGQEGLDGLGPRVEGVAVRRRHVVVHRRERAVGPPHGPAGEAQALEGLRRRHLVDQVAVDVDERRAGLVLGHDEVVVPDLVEERPRRAGRGRAQRRAAAGPRRAARRREAIGTHHHCYGDDRAHGLPWVAACRRSLTSREEPHASDVSKIFLDKTSAPVTAQLACTVTPPLRTTGFLAKQRKQSPPRSAAPSP